MSTSLDINSLVNLYTIDTSIYVALLHIDTTTFILLFTWVTDYKTTILYSGALVTDSIKNWGTGKSHDLY